MILWGETSVDPVWLCRVTGANTSGALFPARPLCASLERRHKPGWAVSGVAGTDGRGLCRRAHSLTAGVVAQAEPDIRGACANGPTTSGTERAKTRQDSREVV